MLNVDEPGSSRHRVSSELEPSSETLKIVSTESRTRKVLYPNLPCVDSVEFK